MVIKTNPIPGIALSLQIRTITSETVRAIDEPRDGWLKGSALEMQALQSRSRIETECEEEKEEKKKLGWC